MTKQYAKLRELCEVISGSTPKTNVPEYWNGTLKWITPAEIGKECYVFDSERHISEEGAKSANLRPLPPGTVILSSRAPIGKTAIAGCELYCNQGFKNLICSSALVPEYLYYFLSYNTRRLNLLGRGATFKELSKSIVENIEIPLINLTQQKHIVHILQNVDRLIVKYSNAYSTLNKIVKSRFMEMFGDIITNSKNWDIQPLGELCTIVRGGSPRPIEKFLGGDIPWIKIGDATKGDSIYIHSTQEHIIEAGVSKSRFIKAGSLIFANCGVSLGFARITTFDGCIHDGWLAMDDISTHLNKVFLLKSLNQITEHFRKIAPAGTQPNLNTAIMKAYKQVVPPLPLQQQFAAFVEKVDKSKLAVKQSLEKLETLKKSLMQQYFG